MRTPSTNKLLFNRLAARTECSKQRKHFVYKVREVLKQLPEKDFNKLIVYALAPEHVHALREYLLLQEEEENILYLLETSTCKQVRAGLAAEKRRVHYLKVMYKKTITNILTTIEPNGYNSEVVEYLLINNLWSK
jgi:hypothetical protein